jgi:hypothetical protein
MATTEEIIANNTKKIQAFIDGDGESVAIGDVVIIRVHRRYWKYSIHIGRLIMYADDIDFLGCFAQIRRDGVMVGSISLIGE